MAKVPVIDFHAHVFPGSLKGPLGRLLEGALADERVATFRKRARSVLRPVTGSLHRVQTLLRVLPTPAIRSIDQVAALAPVPNFLFESTPQDLLEGMSEAGIDYAVVIAHPPAISNEFILDLCSQYANLLPVVNIPSGTAEPGKVLRGYAERGIKAVKIHAAADGEGVDSPRYRAILRVADELGIPVILHTGCMHSHIFYRDPEQGHAQRFAAWFKRYPRTRFILAHMNYHFPNVALDLAEEHPNLLVDTSWQPAEMIGEAVRRIGAERVLFGSDWPIMGNNFQVGVRRVRDCVETGMIDEDQAGKILGGNAAEILGIAGNAGITLHAD